MDTIKKVIRHPKEQNKIFGNYISNKGLDLDYTKNSYN